MVWCGVVWCGVVWCGVVWCGVVLMGGENCFFQVFVVGWNEGNKDKMMGNDLKWDKII